jgi:solute carrier family 13 (sodium-dependent dicarboxylate transporter), member 2/3/5
LEVTDTPEETSSPVTATTGRLTQGQTSAVIALAVAVFLWITPDLLASIWQTATGAVHPAITWLQGHVTATVAALVSGGMLFFLPARESGSGRALSWPEAARIDWGIVLLFGGGIALGQAMVDSGLARTLGDVVASASGANSVWTITAVCVAGAILLSELSSNTAAATILVPISIGLAQGAGVSPIAPALGAAIGASFGFMLPVSTPPNAIVFSSGEITSREMIVRGILVDVLGFIVTMACLRIFLPLIGLA